MMPCSDKIIVFASFVRRYQVFYVYLHGDFQLFDSSTCQLINLSTNKLVNLNIYMVYEFLAEGFEDIEALAPVDILRRGGVEVKTVSITGSEYVKSAHGVTVKADTVFENVDSYDDADLLLLPGGMPGSLNLKNHDGVKKVVSEHNEKGRYIGAICAAPSVLGALGLLKGKKVTCYPGFEKYLDGAEYTAQLFTVDGNIITGKGPAASFPYAYRLLSLFRDGDDVKAIADGMIFSDLMAK